MNYREHTLLANTTYLADKTEIIDIDVKDPISQIGIYYRPTYIAVTAHLAHPISCLKKVELVDGSEVLWSLSGAETQALDYYHRLVESFNYMDNTIGGTPEVWAFINFGRFLWDTEMAFNPTNFNNPQLKITVDINAPAADIITGSMGVFARMFDEKVISPSGFLMAKEIQEYSLANNAHEYIDMPTDLAWRKLLIRAQEDGSGLTSQLAHIKLSQDGDKHVIIDEDSGKLVHRLISQIPPYREHLFGSGYVAATNHFCTPALHCRFGGAQWRAAVAVQDEAFYAGDGGRFSHSQTGAGPNWQCIVEGWLPHAVLDYSFGIQSEKEDWFVPPASGSVKLDLTGGAAVAGEICEVCLQQYRPY